MVVVKDRLPFSPSLLRDMWTTPHGKETARKLVFRGVPYREYLNLPLVLLSFEVLRRGAFADPLTADQDKLLWKLTGDLHAAFAAGDIGTAEVLSLLFTWRGSTNILGWAGVAPKLSAQVRGPAAYVSGHRFLRLGKPEEARTFFQSALKDAAPDSDLRRLAQAELDRLKP